MKLLVVKYLLLFYFFLFFCSCERRSDIIASVEGDPIFTNELDLTIQDPLYESIFGIYYKRKIALEEYISYELLKREAQRRKISVDSLKSLVQIISEKGYNDYVVANHLQEGVPDTDNPSVLLPSNSPKGRVIIERSYKSFLMQDFTDGLKKKYSVEYNLTPPLPPAKDLKNLVYRVRGRLNSKIRVTIVSNFECGACHEFAGELKKIYQLKKNEIEFRFVDYSSTANIANSLCHFAEKQGKFWEMHDAIFDYHPVDTAHYISLAKRVINFDENEFRRFVQNSVDRINREIEDNHITLTQQRISQTPTLLINDRIYYGNLNAADVIDFLEDISLSTFE